MENKKEPIKIKLSTAILLFIIFILIFVIAEMYVHYSSKDTSKEIQLGGLDNNIENKNIENKNIEEEKNENNTNLANKTIDTEIINVDVNSELIKKLYNYILKFSDYDETLVYQDKKVTNETISNKLKMLTIFSNLAKSEADDGIKKEEGIYNAPSEQYIYSIATIEKKSKEIFNTNIRHEKFKYEALGEGILYENNKYEHYYFQGGGDVPWSTANEIVKAEKQGEQLYIYDKYIHIIHNDDGGIKYYTSSDKIKETTKNGYTNYKHTFMKNIDGSYYWYSTEPVK